MDCKIGLGIVTGTYSHGWIGGSTITTTAGTTTGTAELAVDRIVSDRKMTTDPRVLPIKVGNNPLTLVNSYDYNGVGELGQPGRALYGIYNPTPSAPNKWTLVEKAQCNGGTSTEPEDAPVPGVQQWSTTNPHGVVVVGNFMYLIANDCDPNTGKCGIYEYNMVNNAFNEVRTVYEFNPREDSSIAWKGAGYGLDLYSVYNSTSEEWEHYLIAVFARFTNEGWNYTFGDSAIVKIKLADGSATMAAANANVNGVVVNGDYAFVTSFGGAQVPLGNDTSKLEIFKINEATPILDKTIDSAKVNALVNPSGAESSRFKGDFVDTAFVGDKVYILLAHYNADYSKYVYIIIVVLLTNLKDGNLNGAKFAGPTEVEPTSPCFALLPGEGTDLYFVDGVHVNKIDTTVAIDAFSTAAIIEQVSAGDFTMVDQATGDTLTGGLINTAAVVMERTVPAPAMRMAAGAVKASVTKIAKRLARPDELERKE